jgi:hypothetical protein
LGEITPPLNGDIMKADKNFRLNKPAKRVLATILDQEQYTLYKKFAIEGQIAKERARFSTKKEKVSEE